MYSRLTWVKELMEVKQICISVNKMDCDIADHMMERGGTRSVLTNWSETTELTIQSLGEECGHFIAVSTIFTTPQFQIVECARHDDATQAQAQHRVGALSPMPSCLGIGEHTGGSRKGHPRYTSAHTMRKPWVARPHCTVTQHKDAGPRWYLRNFSSCFFISLFIFHVSSCFFMFCLSFFIFFTTPPTKASDTRKQRKRTSIRQSRS